MISTSNFLTCEHASEPKLCMFVSKKMIVQYPFTGDQVQDATALEYPQSFCIQSGLFAKRKIKFQHLHLRFGNKHEA
jgi:hypothetical protein